MGDFQYTESSVSNNKQPWDAHPDLTPERLRTIASILVGVLAKLAAVHTSRYGEREWIFGSRLAQRTWTAIQLASKEYPWIEVLDPSNHFRFGIGNVSMRWAAGKTGRLKPSMRRPDVQECRELQDTLFDMNPTTDGELLVWRLVTDLRNGTAQPVVRLVIAWTDRDREVGGIPYRSWSIPVDRTVAEFWRDREDGLEEPFDVEPVDFELFDDDMDSQTEAWG